MTPGRELETPIERAKRLEALGLLAATVAHDFNNILTAMVGYLEFALAPSAGPIAEPARHHLEEARGAADRACDLARQLLAVVKEPPPGAPRPGAFGAPGLSVDDLILRCSGLLRRLLGDLELVLDLQAPSARILGDPSQLEQVLLNLTVNARDAMTAGGALHISTAEAALGPGEAESLGLDPGLYVLVRASDTGTGMSDSVMLRIFDPFFTTKPEKGTGLGLSIVRAAVSEHGGAIAVDSAPGEGTTFRIYLPVSR